MPAVELEALGWTRDLDEAFEPFAEQGFTPARVAVRFGAVCRLYTEAGEVQGSLVGKLRRSTRRSELPVVGDWVAARQIGTEQKATIHDVLPRRSKISRKVAGRTVEEQVLAANLDTVFIMSGLDGELNPRRLERYLAAASASQVAPVLVLNKIDTCDNVQPAVSDIESIAQGAPIALVSARSGAGLEALRPYCRPGQTIAVLGSSGVGKSTLINRLLGSERLKTREVRADDRKGRHTTTQRELLKLPDGGLIIDTPGLRELQLWELEETPQTFDDIEELARSCRFGNCQHRQEPGCAVREAVAAGQLVPERLESFLKLRDELQFAAANSTSARNRNRKRNGGRSTKRQGITSRGSEGKLKLKA